MEKKRIICIIAICIMAILLGACGSNGLYQSGKEGYSEITSIDGVKFDIVSSIARNATAVTNISEEMEFEANQVYVYKDGESAYFLFKMDAIVCVAQKGTHFGFRSGKDKLASLANSDILGVWFESPKKKKLVYDETSSDGIYKMMATVTAEVTLTSELYSDFAGKLAVVDDGTTEWSLFIGSIGNNFDELNKDERELIEYMARSFMAYEKSSTEVEVSTSFTAVETDRFIMEEKMSHSDENASEDTATEYTEELSVEMESLIEETEEMTSSEYELNEIEVDESQAEISEIEVIEVFEETEEELTQETTENIDEFQQKEQERHSTIILNNQKNTVKEDNKVYYSDIYDMLPLNKYGYASVRTNRGYEKAVVKLDTIYIGQDAVRIIKDGYIKAGERYFESQEGTSWHVAHYTVDYSECSDKGYLDVKLRGMDGEDLRFRGISYSKRTYVIPVSDNEYYCFYEVPNGCKEYVLECGDGSVDSQETIAAYYMYRR